MNKFVIALIGTVFAILTASSNLSSQKIGFLDTGILLKELPAVKAADAKLITFQDQMSVESQSAYKEYEEAYHKLVSDANSGTLSKKEIAQREEALRSQQAALAQKDQEITNKIMKKREELLRPILNQVDNVIRKYGKDHGYDFIFDQSVGNMRHVSSGDDIYDAIYNLLK